MKKAVLVLLALFMAISCFPNTAKADDSSLIGGTAGTVYPIYDTQVEMEEEIIDITVRDGCSFVSCQFFFHNTGDRTRLLMGFPTGRHFEKPDKDSEGPEDEYETNLNWFRTFIHGKRVPVKIRSGLKPEGNNLGGLYFSQWHTWKAALGKGERLKVVNKYWMVNTQPVLGSGSEQINYVLRSGSTWKGPIGKVTVRMKFEGYNAAGLEFEEMQPSYIKKDGTIVWTAENIEPREDIEVFYNTDIMSGEEMDNPYDASDKRYDEYDSMQERMIRNFKIKHYNGTTWWGNRLLRKFGNAQSNQFYYAMGVSYYKLHKYEKALFMLQNVENRRNLSSYITLNYFYNLSLYYEAAIYRKTGYEAKYRECLQRLARQSYPWLQLWAQSRLKEMGVAC